MSFAAKLLGNTSKIVIVGAGPTGIFAAIKLKQLGYKNITLIEKANQICDYTRFIKVDNYVFDNYEQNVQTSFDGDVRLCMQNMLEDAGLYQKYFSVDQLV